MRNASAPSFRCGVVDRRGEYFAKVVAVTDLFSSLRYHSLRWRKNMSGKDLFGALTRWTGMLLIATGAYQAQGLVDPARGYSPKDYVATVGVYLGLGVLYLFGGGFIASVVYWGKRTEFP